MARKLKRRPGKRWIRTNCIRYKGNFASGSTARKAATKMRRAGKRVVQRGTRLYICGKGR